MASYIVAVTGGIASGKSEVTRRFEAHRIHVADADVAARRLVMPGQPALDEIVGRFGAGVLHTDGTLDRAGLRTRVFDDAEAKRALEGILHPRIRTVLRAECEAAASAYALVAIPLLTEGGGRAAYPWLNRILVVDIDPGTQIARLLRRDGIDRAIADRMLAAQAGREARLAIADDVIANDGALDALDAKVDALHRRYLQAAAPAPL